MLLRLFIPIIFLINTIYGINCPGTCSCRRILDSLEIDCSNRNLFEYPDFSDIPVEHLDLSNNNFVDFPTQLANVDSLIYLDLTGNKIKKLYKNSLVGFNSLRTLILANNSIDHWKDINPNTAFDKAMNLQTLSLAWNPIKSFSDIDETFLLVSDTVTKIDISYCQIAKPTGDFVLTGVPHLETLIIKGNELKSLVSLPSSLSLKFLDLSECSLTKLGSNVLKNLEQLEVLNLSNNPGLTFGTVLDGVLESPTLKKLDLSYCNLNSVELDGFPQLTKLKLQGNMLRKISTDMFLNNLELEILNLSENSINFIDSDAFSSLTKLISLDLSFNVIGTLDSALFKSNPALTHVNLSRNFISKLSKVISNSLRNLNLSSCGILKIDRTALMSLKVITILDLSYNLLSNIPNELQSSTLSYLDVSTNRLSSINNNTFGELPQLSRLKMNGNRFTNTMNRDYFKSNKYLDDIWLGDNPWRCDCDDQDFRNFFEFLITKPQKLKDKIQLRCASPTQFHGKQWDVACINVWYMNRNKTAAEKIWTICLVCIIGMLAMVFGISCFKNYLKERKERRGRDELRENEAEMRRIRRENQMMLEQEAQLNAPNTRESSPPNYEEALLLAKPLERSFKSMDELSNNRSRKQMLRNKTDLDIKDVDDFVVYDSHRFRSEEMLSNRDKERTINVSTFRRTGDLPRNNSGIPIFQINDSKYSSSYIKAKNLESAEQIANFQSYENSPYTKRKKKHDDLNAIKFQLVHNNSQGIEFNTDSETNSLRNSPFARRKPIGSTNSILSIHSDKGSSGNLLETNQKNVEMLKPIEDYFGKQNSIKSKNSSIDGDDFQIMRASDVDLQSISTDTDSSKSPARYSMDHIEIIVHDKPTLKESKF